MRRALALLALWTGLVAATPRPLVPPPPDLAPLVGFVAAPLDKPPVLADVPLPPPPVDLPVLPPAAVVVPAADKPVASVTPPRALPCIGAWTGVASESLECGRARFQRGEYEDAARALENAARAGTDGDLLREARYWLGETYYRLERFDAADRMFRQVLQDGTRHEWRAWALHASGWTALRLGDAARAREAFTTVLGAALPAAIEPWARHGLGLAQYALGRQAEAVETWTSLLERGAPGALARDVLFWHGDALGRTGEPGRAEADLRRFVDGGAHPLLATAQLRLGWWALAAGHAPEALAALRAGPPPAAGERDWREAGTALALLATGDWKGARDTAAALGARRSPLTVALLLRLIRAAADTPQTADVDLLVQDALTSNLTPDARGWVLIAKGEIDRGKGNRDEARTQFDLARQTAPGTPSAPQAAFRLARANFELREFRQATAEAGDLVAAGGLPPALRAAVLHLQGEAAYQAGDYAAAGAAFRRALAEFPDSTETPMVRQAIAWTSLRQGHADDARREFLEFARATPEHPNAADALELVAELTLAAGQYDEARRVLDRVIDTYPTQPRADFARINRGILLVRTGDAAEGKTALTDWLARQPFPALSGRAHAALAVALLDTGDAPGAQHELELARKEGLGAFASAGGGVIALQQKRWDEAVKRFEDARDAGTPDIVATAEYGLAVVSFARGKHEDFRKPAEAALAAVPPGRRGAARSGALLYVLAGVAAEEKDWPAALAFARRLLSEQPEHEAADDALERVAAGAAHAQAWSTASEADTLLRQKYPNSPFVAGARLRLAESLVETGKASEARAEVEKISAERPDDPAAILLLARVRDAAGDRAGALEAYSRAARDGRGGPEWTPAALMGNARLLVQEQRGEQARSILDRLLHGTDTAVAAEAAQVIGDSYAGEGDTLAAAEYYLTAAYVAPASPSGLRGLLGAARAFASLKQPDATANACRKLLAQSDLPSELASAARQGPCSSAR